MFQILGGGHHFRHWLLISFNIPSYSGNLNSSYLQITCVCYVEKHFHHMYLNFEYEIERQKKVAAGSQRIVLQRRVLFLGK